MTDPLTITGILNAQTISYAGFAILGVFLLVVIGWGIVQLFHGGGDLFSIAMTAVTGAIVLILAYVIIYNVANVYVINTPENDSLEQYQEIFMMNDMGMIYAPKQLIIPTDQAPNVYINNFRLCADDTIPCRTTGLTNTNIMVYWEVENGIGCCNSFGCNYQLFTNFCGSPFTSYKLYDIALDGEIYQWGPTVDQYDYECSYETPWNYFNYYNIGTGFHTITIWQKDCNTVVDTMEISFFMADLGDGTYEIVQ